MAPEKTVTADTVGTDVAFAVYEMMHERDDLEQELHDDPHRILTEVFGIQHREDN
jgi:hypothetical protein